MPPTYRNAVLGGSANPDQALVRALQHDLRALGYLKRGIDGNFGEGTRLAVRRLQYDLLHNDGRSKGGDGAAPIGMTAFNRGVVGPSGVVDAATADSIEALIADPGVPRLPSSSDPKTANQSALALVAGTPSTVAPPPILLAMFVQESGSKHFSQPEAAGDSDTFITLGLDTNGQTKDEVTSRGYGLGQYTLFHHPPRPEEVADLMLDPIRNTRKAFGELRDKFDNFLVGRTSATQADDRMAEHPLLALRVCRYGLRDPRYMSACVGCARAARKIDIAPGTPVFKGSADTYGQAAAYGNASYAGVPDRADFQCDWPYAVRRYNGSGPDSYNYQAIVLSNLLSQQPNPNGTAA